MLPQLETLIKSRIQSQEIADRVSYEQLTGAFMDSVAHATMVLVCGVCERAEPSLKEMRKTNWASECSAVQCITLPPPPS